MSQEYGQSARCVARLRLRDLGGVADLDVRLGEPASVDLKGGLVVRLRPVARAVLRLAGLHVEDVHDAEPLPRGLEEGDRQWDQGVLHPEPAAAGGWEQEDHPRVAAEALAMHESRPL